MDDAKRRSVAAGEGWEIRWMLALQASGRRLGVSVNAQKVHVQDCRRDGDIVAIVGDDHVRTYAFELQVARPSSSGFSWSGSKLIDFIPHVGEAIALLGCPGRSDDKAFVLVNMETLRDICRCAGGFAGVRYFEEGDYYVLTPTIMEAFSVQYAESIESLADLFVGEHARKTT